MIGCYTFLYVAGVVGPSGPFTDTRKGDRDKASACGADVGETAVTSQIVHL